MFNHTIFNFKDCIHNWKFDFIKNLASLCIYVVETNLSSKRIHLKNAVILQNINGLFNLYILCIWFTTYYLLTYLTYENCSNSFLSKFGSVFLLNCIWWNALQNCYVSVYIYSRVWNKRNSFNKPSPWKMWQKEKA